MNIFIRDFEDAKIKIMFLFITQMLRSLIKFKIICLCSEMNVFYLIISRAYISRHLKILIACHRPLRRQYRDLKVTLNR